MEQFHATTIIAVRRGNDVAIGGDGQVTLGNVVIKATARKIRRLYKDSVLAGLRAPRPMRLPCWSSSRPSLKNTMAI